MPLTPQFIMNLESRMRLITEKGYAGLSSNLWWSKVARLHPSASKRDIIAFLISTATIEDQGDGGNVAYDEIEALYTEVTNRQRGKGLRISVNELKDLDGNGLAAAAQWSSDMGQAFAYEPQRAVADLLKTGTAVKGYDGKYLFATDHPLNPVDTAAGLTFANYFTGGVNGVYPGALPIDETVTPEVALGNLGKLYTYFAGIAHPNGVYPRRLRPVALLVPPALGPRATLLTDAKFIAMSAGAAAAQGGSTDVQGLIGLLNFGKPIVCDEFGANFLNGSNTTYYVKFAPDGLVESQLGAVLYVEREPYSILYHGPMDQAELDRKDLFEWKSRGRNTTSPGHPFEIAKVLGS